MDSKSEPNHIASALLYFIQVFRNEHKVDNIVNWAFLGQAIAIAMPPPSTHCEYCSRFSTDIFLMDYFLNNVKFIIVWLLVKTFDANIDNIVSITKLYCLFSSD